METRSVDDIEAATERLVEDLKAVVRDGEDLLKAGARDLTERGMAARERLSTALESAKETQQNLQAQAAAQVKAADRMVRDYPYHSLGVALGVGLLIGILAGRR
jgi:ElaB/YqjD/DUF883 family membrane-anchored ribosome-binding protein